VATAHQPLFICAGTLGKRPEFLAHVRLEIAHAQKFAFTRRCERRRTRGRIGCFDPGTRYRARGCWRCDRLGRAAPFFRSVEPVEPPNYSAQDSQFKSELELHLREVFARTRIRDLRVTASRRQRRVTRDRVNLIGRIVHTGNQRPRTTIAAELE
jgi:hypothetical protein